MQIQFNAKIAKWFDDNNISFDNRFRNRLRDGGTLTFRDDLEVEPYIGIHGGFVICSMGFMSYTNSAVSENLKVGRYCCLSYNIKFPRYQHPLSHISTSIFTHDRATDLVARFIKNDNKNFNNFYDNPQKGSITIGHDVWIGQDVSIMPGITIGTGSVIAANSVVTKSVMPYEIVGGNPAKLIRMRFSPSIINRLLLSEWWDYKFTDFWGIDLSNPEEFLEKFERRKNFVEKYSPKKIKLREVAELSDIDIGISS
jgi:virginiamycin A acetyltransferase